MAKGRNGVGDQVVVKFNATDPAERKALEAAHLLAAKHGRRKAAIIALLEAVYDRYEDSGCLMTSAEITAALMGQAPAPARAPVGFPAATAGQIVASDMTAEQRQATLQHSDNSPGVVIAKGSGKDSAQTVADNFLSSVGRAFYD
jgi:hypothetical protein